VIERNLLTGGIHTILLYVASERRLTSWFLHLIQRTQLARILHKRFTNVPRIALTATADTVTRTEIIQRLDLDHARFLFPVLIAPLFITALSIR
jgi:ATP-dependent DNA helicase RecQ